MIDLTHEELTTAHRAARGAVNRYRRYVQQDDVEQELRLWMLDHEDDLRKWRGFNNGLKALHRSLMRVAHKFCEREKAAVVGYHHEDNKGYGPALLRELLKDALKDDWSMVSGVDGHPHSAVAVSLIDVRRGLKMLRERDAETLVKAVSLDYDYDRMAELETTEDRSPSPEAMRLRVYRALKKLSTELSWPSEKSRDDQDGRFDPRRTVHRYSDANVLRKQLGEAA